MSAPLPDTQCVTFSSMKIGVLIFPTDQTIDPIELAREADDAESAEEAGRMAETASASRN